MTMIQNAIDKAILGNATAAGGAAADVACGATIAATALGGVMKAAGITGWEVASDKKDAITSQVWKAFQIGYAERYAERLESEPSRAAVLAWSIKNIPGANEATAEDLNRAKNAAQSAWKAGAKAAFGPKPRTVAEDATGGEGGEGGEAATTAGEAAVLGPEQAALALAGHYVKDDPDAVKALAHLLLVVASNPAARNAAAKAVAKAIK